MKRGGIIKVSAARMVKFQTDKAVREGRLHKVCFSCYGAAFTRENFCPGCDYKEICLREQRSGRRGREP